MILNHTHEKEESKRKKGNPKPDHPTGQGKEPSHDKDLNRGRNIGGFKGDEYPADDLRRGENIGVYSGDEYPAR